MVVALYVDVEISYGRQESWSALSKRRPGFDQTPRDLLNPGRRSDKAVRASRQAWQR